MNPTYLFLRISLFSLFLFFSPAYAHNKSHETPKKNPPQPTHSSSSSSSSQPTHSSSSSTQPTHSSSSSSSSSSMPGSFKGSFSAVFAFGDSYTGTGNAHGTGSGHASTTTRECDGRQLVDFLCDSLSLPPLPAYKGTTSGNFKHGVNFAISGSMPPSSDGKNKDHAGMWSEFFENVQTQINGYNKVAQEIKGGNPSSGTAKIEGALFWVGAMGVKTYANNSWSSTTPLNKLTDLSVIHICGLVQSLLDSGAKYIVVQGLPPVGCLPLCLLMAPPLHRDKHGCSAIINAAVMIHNEILQAKIENFQRRYPSHSIIYADFFKAFLTILMNPSKYHFQEHFKACCGTGGGEFNINPKLLCGSHGTSTCKEPGKYMNWDGIHLTEAMHKQITDLFLHQGFCTPSFDQLIKKKIGK
ncbi:hypothetical protein HYC85_015446 [Camellia sinensis]|uniref:Uncharacterized protein n=1 Tax=Camellia sinensis TaxID=4442 RepID=A0A7J7H0P3_CAMSI|nr:hypothetical protein HYC85_015446 [Camellia sinensis]